MRFIWRKTFFILYIFSSITACSANLTGQITPTATELHTSPATTHTISSPDPTQQNSIVDHTPSAVSPLRRETVQPVPPGPILLLQTEADAYSQIHFSTLEVFSFIPPGPNQQHDLAANRSPSGTQMLFEINQHETVVYSFVTGAVLKTYLFDNDSSFQPKQVMHIVREALPGLAYSDEALLSALENAYARSKQKIKWYQSERYCLVPLDNGKDSTQLTLDDHQTGVQSALEDMPALVEDFWISPAGDLILLKKSYVFEPDLWQDDRYYLVDVRRRKADPIPLPENADNPRVFWFSPEKIGVIHWPELSGGLDFSLLDIETKKLIQVVTGPFAGVYSLGTHMLTLHYDQQNQTSTLRLSSMNSQDIYATQTLEGQCFVSSRVDDRRLLLTCEEESILVEEDVLTLTPFGKPNILLVRSPNGSRIVQVTRDGRTSILNAALDLVEQISLDGDPLEILWLPDSSGFLYRTPRRLYLYQMATKSSVYLLESNLFTDYRNLNAAWIKLGE